MNIKRIASIAVFLLFSILLIPFYIFSYEKNFDQLEKNEEQLEKLADAALKQINERRYNSEMASHGVDKILRYGIAFSGKDTCVKAE